MKLRDEFREPEVITKAAEEIRRRADPIRHYRIMKVCGGHTRAICNSGLKDVLPATRLLQRTSAWRLPWQYRGFNAMEAMT
jgi:hydrogenase expression/formation protein HypD